jgi:hypothetical protein
VAPAYLVCNPHLQAADFKPPLLLVAAAVHGSSFSSGKLPVQHVVLLLDSSTPLLVCISQKQQQHGQRRQQSRFACTQQPCRTHSTSNIKLIMSPQHQLMRQMTTTVESTDNNAVA